MQHVSVSHISYFVHFLTQRSHISVKAVLHNIVRNSNSLDKPEHSLNLNQAITEHCSPYRLKLPADHKSIVNTKTYDFCLCLSTTYCFHNPYLCCKFFPSRKLTFVFGLHSLLSCQPRVTVINTLFTIAK